MNIEDLEYELAAAEINEDLLNRKIQELEEGRYQKFALAGQERQKNPKTEEQIKLEKEKLGYTIRKNNIITLIGSYKNLATQAKESNNIYSRYTIDQFEDLKNSFDQQRNSLAAQINILEEERYQKFALEGQERQKNPKTEEQIKLEEEKLKTEKNFQLVVNIISFYNRVSKQLEDLESLKETNMTEYVKQYHSIIVNAHNKNLPETLIISLMRKGLDKKLTVEEKEKLREKVTNNINEIRYRKAAALSNNVVSKEDEEKIQRSFEENVLSINKNQQTETKSNEEVEKLAKKLEEEIIKINKKAENVNEEKPTPIDDIENQIEKDIIRINTANNTKKSDEEEKLNKKLEDSVIRINRGHNLETRRENYAKMSLEELSELVDKYTKERDNIDNDIVKIDLNADLSKERWEKNTFQAMGDFIKLSNEITLINEVINAKKKEILEENTVVMKNVEPLVESEQEEILEEELPESPFSEVPLTEGRKVEEWNPQSNSDINNEQEYEKRNGSPSKEEVGQAIEVPGKPINKSKDEDITQVESDLYSLKKTWETNSIFKRAIAKVQKKSPNWDFIKKQLMDGETYETLQGGMKL